MFCKYRHLAFNCIPVTTISAHYFGVTTPFLCLSWKLTQVLDIFGISLHKEVTAEFILLIRTKCQIIDNQVERQKICCYDIMYVIWKGETQSNLLCIMISCNINRVDSTMILEVSAAYSCQNICFNSVHTCTPSNGLSSVWIYYL